MGYPALNGEADDPPEGLDTAVTMSLCRMSSLRSIRLASSGPARLLE